MGFMKNFIKDDDENIDTTNSDNYYNIKAEELENGGNSKMILLEPRAYSESYQIIDHLKNRDTVVVNFKRITANQAKRIIDFLTGATYAIEGHVEKIGSGIFLVTPKNVNIQGNITDEKDSTKNGSKEEIEEEW